MIKCISCSFTKEDEYSSDSKWKAYECSNPKSEYHRALLNVKPNGEKLTRISWSGCPRGERGDSRCQGNHSHHVNIMDVLS